ncbi:unnamed protein product [Adineta steineri]|uniref:Uncharacterized protein n=1 Tax=Adineta steineri TaxID=433720 RepID=A0A819S3A5_9BILA|nr:unnamed protein product [Adineta steineri]CAF1500078.1 unnamed protein product [Adineta steineri]CAF3548426.1 unnamed protein product [Adineta steineri]CAF4057712.1 unnamed protein product [Adineta steineri]
MARTNLSVMPDVNICLRDAMDAMFNNGNQNKLNNNNHTIMTPEDSDAIIDVVNDDDSSSIEALQSSINKRKLTNTTAINHEHQNDGSKRLCTTDSHH